MAVYHFPLVHETLQVLFNSALQSIMRLQGTVAKIPSSKMTTAWSSSLGLCTCSPTSIKENRYVLTIYSKGCQSRVASQDKAS